MVSEIIKLMAAIGNNTALLRKMLTENISDSTRSEIERQITENRLAVQAASKEREVFDVNA